LLAFSKSRVVRRAFPDSVCDDNGCGSSHRCVLEEWASEEIVPHFFFVAMGGLVMARFVDPVKSHRVVGMIVRGGGVSGLN